MTQSRIAFAPFAWIAAATIALSVPALADNGKTPPGDPCGNGRGVGRGNPCNGNNGNIGDNGNSGRGGTIAPIPLPPAQSRGAYITQIGSGNQASAAQGSNENYAKVVQRGDGNRAEVTQGASAAHYAVLEQTGDDNSLVAVQAGMGRTVLLSAQQGNGNRALVHQTEDGQAYSAAAIRQSGTGNQLTLLQDGSDNQARLTQNGDNNAMTATQVNDGNRLDWTQNGTGLADLGIVQTGGGTLQITQSTTGAQFAPPPSAPGR